MVPLASILVICFVTNICAYKADWSKSKRRSAVLVVLILCSIVLIPVALFAPVAGFEEMQCVEEIELLPLRDMEKEGTWYLYYEGETFSNGARYTYAFDNRTQYNLEGEAYHEKTISPSRIGKIYESEECTRPVLKKFVTKGKASIFSFAIGCEETETILFIPQGTILEKNKE